MKDGQTKFAEFLHTKLESKGFQMEGEAMDEDKDPDSFAKNMFGSRLTPGQALTALLMMVHNSWKSGVQSARTHHEFVQEWAEHLKKEAWRLPVSIPPITHHPDFLFAVKENEFCLISMLISMVDFNDDDLRYMITRLKSFLPECFEITLPDGEVTESKSRIESIIKGFELTLSRRVKAK